MLILSLPDCHVAGQVKSRDSRYAKQQYAGANLREISSSPILRRPAADVDAACYRSEENRCERNRAQNKAGDAVEHGALSPMASLLVSNYREVVEFIEFTLLGAIVFCIGFAVTAGI